MKNTRLPRWIAIFAFASSSLLTTSCGNFFWKAEQTVVPAKRGPLAFSQTISTRAGSGTATTTLHNVEGDTLPHRWENGKLKFYKSERKLYLVVRDTEGVVLSCSAFYFRERTFFRKRGDIPVRKLPLLERNPYTSWATSVGLLTGMVYNNANPYVLSTPILLGVTGVTADLATYAVGLYRTKKDPRRTLGLVQIHTLHEGYYPDFLTQGSETRPAN